MKKVIFTIMAFISVVISNAQSWSTLVSGTTNNLRAVHFPSSTIGYAVGNDGTIIKTINGGTSWTSLTSSYPGFMFWDVHFVSPDTGYVCGESDPGFDPSGLGTIIKTTDGGLTWTTSVSGSAIPMRDLFVINKDTLFACGGAEGINGKIIKSYDGGTTWSPIGPTYYDAMLGGLYFLNANNGFLGVYESVFGTTHPTEAAWLGTVDGGTTFSSLVITGSSSYWNFSTDFPDQNTGYSTRSTYAIDVVYLRKTTDGGITWTENTIAGFTGSIYCNDFLNASNGYIVGGSGVIKKTIDGGATWTTEISGTTEDLHSVFFVSSALGFAVGDNGKILKYSSGVTDILESFETSTALIYPTPSNDFFQIKNIENNHQLDIFNSNGQLILSQADIGESSKIDIRKLPKGAYIVKLSKKNEVIISKIIKQ